MDVAAAHRAASVPSVLNGYGSGRAALRVVGLIAVTDPAVRFEVFGQVMPEEHVESQARQPIFHSDQKETVDVLFLPMIFRAEFRDRERRPARPTSFHFSAGLKRITGRLLKKAW